jgi:hypothetical protein
MRTHKHTNSIVHESEVVSIEIISEYMFLEMHTTYNRCKGKPSILARDLTPRLYLYMSKAAVLMVSKPT